MKKYKVFITIVICSLMINSCSESDLELTNPNQLSPESFFKNEAQIQSAVNAAYANLQTRGLYSRQMYFINDGMGQEISGNPQFEADKKSFVDFSFDSSENIVADYWETCFRGINKSNFVIGNSEAINLIPDGIMSAARKNKFIAEAKFLRGFYYFLLVTKFGDIPLITSIPEGGTGFPRSPKADVYEQIVQDLKDASLGLLEKGAEDVGRATKGAAIGLLGKVYLFMGEHQLALTEFIKLDGPYDLEPNFYDNFKIETEHGIESIFEVEYDAALGFSAEWNSSVSGEGLNETTFRGQEYGFRDWFNVYPSDGLLDEYEAGDPRYADTFYSVGDTYANGAATVTAGDLMSGTTERRAGWKKYQNYYKDTNEDMHSGINGKVIRFADVLLMMAECENEVGTQANAAGYINRVRGRVSMPAISLTLSKTEIFDAIVHERRVELAGEQTRFPDLLRWGIAATELSGSNFQAGKHELLPIPDREISSNDMISDADQNPSY